MLEVARLCASGRYRYCLAGAGKRRPAAAGRNSGFPRAGAAGRHSGSAADPRGQPCSRRQADTIRVDVNLLDKLMNLAGELVLTRNQIAQFSARQSDVGFLSMAQTTESRARRGLALSYPIFIGTAGFPFSRECAAREVLLRSTNELDRWERRYVGGPKRLRPGFISRFIRNSPSFNHPVTLHKYK